MSNFVFTMRPRNCTEASFVRGQITWIVSIYITIDKLCFSGILRLGCLVRNKGDLHHASLLFKESMGVNPSHPDPWTLIGNMHMSKEEWGPAQKKFEQILKLTNNTDVYSFIALGNIWLEMLFASKTREKVFEKHKIVIIIYFLGLTPPRTRPWLLHKSVKIASSQHLGSKWNWLCVGAQRRFSGCAWHFLTSSRSNCRISGRLD